YLESSDSTQVNDSGDQRQSGPDTARDAEAFAEKRVGDPASQHPTADLLGVFDFKKGLHRANYIARRYSLMDGTGCSRCKQRSRLGEHPCAADQACAALGTRAIRSSKRWKRDSKRIGS